MSSESFRRRTQRCVDSALHQIHRELDGRPYRRRFLDRLVAVVRERSSLLQHAPSPSGGVVGATLLYNLLWLERAAIRAPESWPGAWGHPLLVAHSLASHLFGEYPVPRFLAWCWLQQRTPEQRRAQQWFIAHARGRALRQLPLPIALTRRMEHELLRTPDHMQLTPALRRAEVLGLGGSEALAQAVLATPLAASTEHGAWWRKALTWMVARGDTLAPQHVARVVAYLHARCDQVSLQGKTVASLLRDLDREAPVAGQGGRRRLAIAWPRSRWRALSLRIDRSAAEPRVAQWDLVELCDHEALRREGREMRHCVGCYAGRCRSGYARIWSLRHRWLCEDKVRSVLTIEIDPARGRIVQVRGKANRRPSGLPLELLERWASREALIIDPRACGTPPPAAPAPAAEVPRTAAPPGVMPDETLLCSPLTGASDGEARSVSSTRSSRLTSSGALSAASPHRFLGPSNALQEQDGGGSLVGSSSGSQPALAWRPVMAKAAATT